MTLIPSYHGKGISFHALPHVNLQCSFILCRHPAQGHVTYCGPMEYWQMWHSRGLCDCGPHHDKDMPELSCWRINLLGDMWGRAKPPWSYQAMPSTISRAIELTCRWCTQKSAVNYRHHNHQLTMSKEYVVKTSAMVNI